VSSLVAPNPDADRVGSLLRALLGHGRYVLVVLIPVAVQAPARWLGLAAAVALWALLVLRPAELPLEARRTSLAGVAFRPPRGALGPLPVSARGIAMVVIAAATLPIAVGLLTTASLAHSITLTIDGVVVVLISWYGRVQQQVGVGQRW
jgi:hypothetical protein